MDPKREKLMALIRRHPGHDGIALKGKGWRPQVHGSLLAAMLDGVIVYRNGGWYVASDSEIE